MELLSNLPAGILMFFGAFMILINYVRQISNFKKRNSKVRSWSSPKPFIGPILLIIGYSLLPITFSNWIYLIILLDPDTLLMILSMPYILIKGLGK